MRFDKFEIPKKNKLYFENLLFEQRKIWHTLGLLEINRNHFSNFKKNNVRQKILKEKRREREELKKMKTELSYNAFITTCCCY